MIHRHLKYYRKRRNLVERDLQKIHSKYCSSRDKLIEGIYVEFGIDDYLPLSEMMDEDILDELQKTDIEKYEELRVLMNVHDMKYYFLKLELVQIQNSLSQIEQFFRMGYSIEYIKGI